MYLCGVPDANAAIPWMSACVRFRIASESESGRLGGERLDGSRNSVWCYLGLSHRLDDVSPLRAVHLARDVSMVLTVNTVIP